jgi:uncharacterized OsmC-like protein
MPKIKTKAIWVENTRSVADNQRTHSVVCDLPSPKGGADTGPTAIELCLMALADCAVTIFANVCKKSSIQPKKIEATVEADKAPDSPAVTGVTLKVNVVSNAREGLVNAAWRRTEANCPVILIFKQSTLVKVEFEGKTE